MSAPLCNLQQRFEAVTLGLEGGERGSHQRGLDGEGDGTFGVRREVDPWLAFCDALDAVGPAVNAYIAAERR